MAALAAFIGLADTSAASAEGALRTWTLFGSFRQIHNSNIFTNLLIGQSDVISVPTLSLSYVRTTETTSISASASGYGTRYAEQNRFNRLGGNFSLGGSHRFSPRVRLGMSLGTSTSLPTETLFLSRALIPQVDTSGKGGGAHLSYDVSRTTIATVDASAFVTHVNALTPLPGLNLDPTLVPPVSFPGLTEPPLAGPSGPLVQVDPSLFALSIIASEGVAFGASDFSVFGGGFGLTHSFSPTLSGTAWFGYSRVDFTRIGVGPANAALDGGRVDVRGTMSRQFGPSSRISLSYVTERNEALEPAVTSHQFVVQADRSFNENVKFDGSFGFSTFSSPRQSIGGTIIGGAGLAVRRRSNNFHVRYDRTTFQAFGLGRNDVSSVGSLNVGRTVSKRLSAWLDGRVRNSQDPFDPTFSVSMESYAAGLSYRFRQRTRLSADYAFIRWTPARSADSIDSTIWSMYVSYGKSFR